MFGNDQPGTPRSDMPTRIPTGRVVKQWPATNGSTSSQPV